MLPFKTKRGQAALKRLNVYEGTRLTGIAARSEFTSEIMITSLCRKHPFYVLESYCVVCLKCLLNGLAFACTDSHLVNITASEPPADHQTKACIPPEYQTKNRVVIPDALRVNQDKIVDGKWAYVVRVP